MEKSGFQKNFGFDYVMWGRFGFDYGGGGGGGGGGSLDYVIRGGGGLVLITVDDGGEGGGKNCQNIDYVICERPLTNGTHKSANST